LGIFEDENEEASSTEDNAIEMEDLLLAVGCNCLAVYEGIIGSIFLKDFDVALLDLCIIGNKGMIGLYSQRSQDDIWLGIALLIADMQFLTGILDSKSQQLILRQIGEVRQIFIDSIGKG
jgi:hypothetical protein